MNPGNLLFSNDNYYSQFLLFVISNIPDQKMLYTMCIFNTEYKNAHKTSFDWYHYDAFKCFHSYQ